MKKRPGPQLDLDFHAPAAAPEALAPAVEARAMLTVTELTRRVRGLLEAGVGSVWVEGEVSNLRRQASGHCYFTLKDAGAQLSCVLFARAAAAAGGAGLADGAQIEVHGGLTVYEPRGQYQIVVQRLRARGAGALHAKFEQLKRKLEAEGLFDPARKRPLPAFPQRIGVVTSPTGAAIRDFLQVLHRRHPGIAVLINPVRVQGAGAAAEIAAAIHELGRPSEHGLPPVDVIVVTRGGGSLEDLWEFNEEAVARAVAASPVPVVSAVGHEIDFSICDFVADVRAPTPSAAAEILSADAAGLRAQVAREHERMARAVEAAHALLAARLQSAGRAALFREPGRLVGEAHQRLDRGCEGLATAARMARDTRERAIERCAARLEPRVLQGRVAHLLTTVQSGCDRLSSWACRRHALSAARLAGVSAKLAALDPAATLARGFTITTDTHGKPLTTAANARKARHLLTRFADGSVASRIEEIANVTKT